MDFIDCQCFAGAFTLGATQAGFRLVHKAEDVGGFGMAMCEANRDLLGEAWKGQDCPPEKWEPVPAHLVVGNPPCSGFSVMSPKSFRGIDSTINQCMRNLFAYAALVRPQAVVMESVPSAFTIGLTLMRALVAGLCQATGTRYFTTHVLQNNLSLGGCTRRRRYFLVATAFPFGVDQEPLKWLPTLGDAIGDLRELPMSWEDQPYTQPPTWWSARQRSEWGIVDGHHGPVLSPLFEGRIMDIAGPDGVEWKPREAFEDIQRRYYMERGDLPESWKYQSSGKWTSHLTKDKVLIDKNFKVGGYSQTKYWPWDEPGFVLTGHGPQQVWHPDGRFITHREAARIMGFPDDWLIEPLAENRSLSAMWGKGISVDCGRWICTWVKNSMEGNPGEIQGMEMGDSDDRIIDASNWWKQAPKSPEVVLPVYNSESG